MSIYRIGEVAERVGVTTRTIRYYEELGLLGAPVALMIVCGAFYSRYSDVVWLRGALAGLGAAAAGLLISLAAKLAAPLLRGRRIPALVFALIAFVAVALLRAPLYWVVLLLAPVSTAFFWWRAR